MSSKSLTVSKLVTVGSDLWREALEIHVDLQKGSMKGKITPQARFFTFHTQYLRISKELSAAVKISVFYSSNSWDRSRQKMGNFSSDSTCPFRVFGLKARDQAERILLISASSPLPRRNRSIARGPKSANPKIFF